ncbi:MAG: hypothetical protein SF053_18650 [Bacteroidia bacterium]|jgi:hypothetical protein|nr:hypothetical protein [Bacteroidia bacterium]
MPIHDATWVKLYELADAFRRLAPWQWMYHTDLFGVKDPETGETGYCCILGRGDASLGMAVYRNQKGLQAYERRIEVEPERPAAMPYLAQDCWIISFHVQEELTEDEKTRIRRLGLQGGEGAQWPLIEDFSPGMVPWPITREEEARFLLLALEQAMYVATQYRDNPEYVERAGADPWQLLIREPHIRENHLMWEDDWVPVPPFVPEARPIPINKLFLRSNLSPLPRSSARWLIDIFYFPSPTQPAQGERPFFPQLMLVIDLRSERVIGHTLFTPGNVAQELPPALVQIIRQYEALPAVIASSNRDVLIWIQLLAAEAGIRLELTMDPQLVLRFKESLFKSLAI